MIAARASRSAAPREGIPVKHMVDPPPAHELEKLVGLIGGYRISQSIYVAVELGIPDLLAHGPRTTSELATATAAHDGNLQRLLRFLASAGLFTEVAPHKFELTRLGAGLRSDIAGSPGTLARMLLHKSHWEPWGHLLEGVSTGRTAFELVHDVGLFEYLEQNQELARLFDAAMTESTARDGLAIANSYDFSNIATVVDVGGGQGLLIASLLQTYPNLSGTLFDLPELVVRGSPLLEKWGVSDRCTVVGGSFFDSVPRGAEVYLLRHIVHDWDDQRACRILRNCRDAAAPGGKVLVVERMISANHQGLALLAYDMEMMVNFGGKERTETEFRELFMEAGLRLARVIGPISPAAHVIIEGKPE